MSLSNSYIDLYNQYKSEIDEIKKSLRMFKMKKNRALKKNILASEIEVLELEASLVGKTFNRSEYLRKKAVEKEQLNKQISELEDEGVGEIIDLLDDEDNTYNDTINEECRVYNLSNGDKFVGNLKEGKMHGLGSYIFADSDTNDIKSKNTEYIGNFNLGIRDGQGIFKFANGNEYTGYFKNNMSNGIGIMKYKNQDEYIGNWIDGKKEGLGIYTWKDGFMYVGNFLNSKMDGVGSCFNMKGETVYQGEWKSGQIHGHGKYIWYKGKFYEGDFKLGQKHGYGIFYLDNIPIYTGTWKFDKPSIFNKTFDEIFTK